MKYRPFGRGTTGTTTTRILGGLTNITMVTNHVIRQVMGCCSALRQSLEQVDGISGYTFFRKFGCTVGQKRPSFPAKTAWTPGVIFLYPSFVGQVFFFHENFWKESTHLEAERPKELQKKNWRSLFKKDKCQCCLGGGNSNISYFHPYLGKWSNLTVSYFSKGWFNHQLVVVGVSFKKPSFLEQFRNGRFDIAMAGKSRLSRNSSGRNSGCLQWCWCPGCIFPVHTIKLQLWRILQVCKRVETKPPKNDSTLAIYL